MAGETPALRCAADYSGHRSGLPHNVGQSGATLSNLLPLGKLRGKGRADGHKLRVLVLVDPFARVHVEVVYLAGTLALVAKHQLVALIPAMSVFW